MKSTSSFSAAQSIAYLCMHSALSWINQAALLSESTFHIQRFCYGNSMERSSDVVCRVKTIISQPRHDSVFEARIQSWTPIRFEDSLRCINSTSGVRYGTETCFASAGSWLTH